MSLRVVLVTSILSVAAIPAVAFAQYAKGGAGDPALAAAQQATIQYEEVPENPGQVYGPGWGYGWGFFNQAAMVRAQRDAIEALLDHCDSPQVCQALTAQLYNRNRWLNKAHQAFHDALAQRIVDRKNTTVIRARGPPQKPPDPVYYTDPNYQAAIYGLPGTPNGIPTSPAEWIFGSIELVSTINTGWQRAGWLNGNEVIIKGHMAENWALEKAYLKDLEEYHRQLKLWEGSQEQKQWEFWDDFNRKQEQRQQEWTVRLEFNTEWVLTPRPKKPKPAAPSPTPTPKPVDPKAIVRMLSLRKTPSGDGLPSVLQCMTSTTQCHQAPTAQNSGYSLSGFGQGWNAERDASSVPISPGGSSPGGASGAKGDGPGVGTHRN